MESNVDDRQKVVETIKLARDYALMGDYEKSFHLYTSTYMLINKVKSKYKDDQDFNEISQLIKSEIQPINSIIEQIKKFGNLTLLQPSNDSNKSKSNPQPKIKTFLEANPGYQFKEFVSNIERDVISKDLNITFNDIVGLDDAKRIIKEAIELPLRFPNLYNDVLKAWKGILLFGPPGTGKTYFAKAVASECKLTFFNIPISNLSSKWHGESEKLIQVLFDVARYYSPSIIFIDEIDSLVSRKSSSDSDVTSKVKSQILAEMDGINSVKDGKQQRLLFIGATNHPWNIEDAMLRRFDKRILVPLPDALNRIKLFKNYSSGVSFSDDIDWIELSDLTELYSCDDIQKVCNDAKTTHFNMVLEQGTNKKLTDPEIKNLFLSTPISNKFILDCIKTNKPTSTPDKLEKYNKWMASFGAN